MKHVLITGKSSFVGNAVRARLLEQPDLYSVSEVSVRDEHWKEEDFSRYDTVFHVAGIAHVSTDPSMKPVYMRVNRDLTIEIAKRAKRSGVGQFIFMSSAIVYGDSTPHRSFRPITAHTRPQPNNFYGESKLQAEEGIERLEDGSFSVALLRCPMIYGPGCTRGNFPTLVKYARRLPLFPDVENRRSMLYSGNLAELVAGLVRCGGGGLFLPQNAEYSKTSNLVRLISQQFGSGIVLTKILNPLLSPFIDGTELGKKVFGNLFFDQQSSGCSFEYRRYSLEESICEIARMDGWHR